MHNRKSIVESEERFMVEVGMKGLPFPIKVLSREDTAGQQTVAKYFRECPRYA